MAEWAGLGLGVVSVIGTLALLILNLKVNGGMQANKTEFISQISELRSSVERQISEVRSGFQIDLGKVELQVANLRGDLYKEHATLYQNVMEKSGEEFMNRNASLTMHEANTKRLDAIEHKLEDLAVKVGDIS